MVEMRPQAMVQPKQAPLRTRLGLPSPCRGSYMASPEILLAPFLVKGKHLDPGSGRVKKPFILERTGHLALQTAGTFLGINR
jgi:hypothetical protein